MPCDMRYARDILPEKLAEQGWSQAEIDLLEKEVELAVQKAKKESYEKRETLGEQNARMAEAEQKARKVAHERMHAAMEKAMDEIRKMGAAKKLPVGHGHGRGGDDDD